MRNSIKKPNTNNIFIYNEISGPRLEETDYKKIMKSNFTVKDLQKIIDNANNQEE